MIFSTILLQTDSTATASANTVIEGIAQTEEMNLFSFLLKGGVFLLPIVVLLFYTIYVIIERYLSIKKATKFDSHLIKDIAVQLNSGNVNGALSLAERSNSAYGNVLRQGILTIGRPISEIESNMERAATIEIGEMERRMGHLGLIAGIAPTLGFVGTISGVIKIFYSISQTEDISIGNISGGLYEKMISSGAGLVVGIIAYAAYHIFNGLIDNYNLNVEKQILEFVSVIQRPNHGSQTK